MLSRNNDENIIRERIDKTMGKVWLKTKFDSGLKMEIPHSINFANAMYGFLEMGAEIIPYHTIDEIYDKVEREDIVLDYIDQCNTIFNKDYKQRYFGYFHRDMEIDDKHTLLYQNVVEILENK